MLSMPASGPELVLSPAEADRQAFAVEVWPGDQPTPTKTIRCRHCSTVNRVRVPSAVVFPERIVCGSCDGALFLRPDEPLLKLSTAAYLHSLDRKLLATLDSIPGVHQLTQWLLSRLGDRSMRLMLMASAVQCGPDQFPELVRLMETARTRLDIPMRPSMFLGESPHMNAISIGFNDPIIVVQSALLDQLTDDEMVAVLGHELGHLHPSHHVYHGLAQIVLMGGATIAGMAGALAMPLKIALMQWQRASELTADRAAVLACRDLQTSVRLMLKFAGGSREGTRRRTKIQLGAFLRQARELARLESTDPVDAALAAWMTMDRTHPFVAWRVMHMVQWVERGRFLDILAGDFPRRQAGDTPVPIRAGHPGHPGHPGRAGRPGRKN